MHPKLQSPAKNILRKGFTLIELLVVIAIISILAAIIMASLSTARAKGRDAKRVSDIKQIQLGLELYYDACGNYPLSIYDTTGNVCGSISSGQGLVAGSFIPNVPTDPSDTASCGTGAESSCYIYVAIASTAGLCAGNTGSPPISYHLGATLETSNTALQNDSDTLTKNPKSCIDIWSSDFLGLAKGPVGSHCSGVAGTQYPGTETCFDVTP